MAANGNILLIILPIFALLLAILSIAGLWLWWRMSRSEQEDEIEQDISQPSPARPLETLDEPLEGSFLTRLAGSFKPARSSGAPELTPAARLPVPGTAAGAVEVMRILRDLADGALVVEIEGRRYRSLQQITDAETGRRFMGNAQALAAFAGLSGATAPLPAEGAVVPSPPPIYEASVSSSAVPVASAVPPAPPAPSARRPESGEKARRRGIFGLTRRAEEDESEGLLVLNMADEIEEILQHRLSLGPLAERSIHIRPAPDGGVRIEVDGRSYDTVDDVPDSSVQDVLRSAIREWEARQ
jgi:hypothetical protein